MKSLIITSLFLFSSSAHTFEDEHIDAHVHGQVEMNLVAEANYVEVQITSPLMNLVGFEYAPRIEAEKQAIHAMAAEFAAPQKWLQFDGSNCQLIEHTINHGDDDHDHGHDHNKHERQHAELDANYLFKCDSARLDSVTVSLQDTFPAIESITLSWIVGNASGLASLHHNEETAYFR